MDAQFVSRLSSLSPAKRQLALGRLLENGRTVEDLPICRQTGNLPSEADTFDAQERLLVLESLRPGTMYNRISLALRLRGRLDPTCLALAFGDLCGRHEGLRTKFSIHKGRWRQIILGRSDVDLNLVDLRSLSPSVLEDEIERRRSVFDGEPLDPESEPPWRVSLLRLGEEDHVLLLCLHHAIADGWSVEVLSRDLSHAYRARLQGTGPVWTHASLQPREYAQFLHDLDLCGALRRRSGDPERPVEAGRNVTSVPADFLRPELPTDRSGVVTRDVGGPIGISLCTVGERALLTPAAIYTTAALITLRDFSGESDLLVAFAVANREHPATHELVAPLVAIRPLRIAIDDVVAIGGLASRVQRELARLAADSRTMAADPEQDSTPRSSPSLRCLLIVQNANRSLIDFPGVDAETLPSRRAGALYDLAIVIQPLSGTCRIAVEYAEDVFAAETAEQLAEHMAEMLRAMANGIERPIADATRPTLAEALDYLPPAPSATVEDAGLRTPIDLVLEQASARPDAIAIDAPSGRTTYAELVRDARRLAAALPGAADGDVRPIGIMTADGALAATAMLASHLAHRPFVMLDARSAPARHVNMLAVCGASAIMFEEGAAAAARSLCAAGGATPVAFADHGRNSREPEAGNRAIPAGADRSPAYIAFTSGSTGQPKGIVQSHIAFAQFLRWQQDAFAMGADSRVAMWSSLAFDACYTEVYGALTAGATLCIPDPDLRRDPNYVINWIERSGITYLLTVPTFLALLVSELAAGARKPSSLRDVAVSGEVLAPDLCRRFQRLLGSVRLHNLFGPTEAVLACSHTVTTPHQDRLRVPVGRPIAGRRLLLADEGGRPVARGAVGEINIISRFLTEGYLVPGGHATMPFPLLAAGRSGERIYRTGDFGRIGRDGALRFLGRRDGQIKIRGVRIMIDEVESVLARHPSVAQCAIVDRSANGSRQLTAFVVRRPNPAPTGITYEQAPRALQAAWRTLLLESLDHCAVPAFFVTAPQLPRTATEKIDYAALRAIDPASIPPAPLFAAESSGEPVPDVAIRIRSAWRSVLPAWARDKDNFFDSGGDSIAAVRLQKALEHACPGMFRLVDIYANPSVQKMCEAVRLRRDGEEQAVSEGTQRALRRKLARTASGFKAGGVMVRARNSG